MAKKEIQLTTNELAFCDLILTGWDATKAYALSHPDTKAKAESIKTQASRLKTSPEIKKYLEERGRKLTRDDFKVNLDGNESLPLTTLSIDNIEIEDNYLTRENQIKRYKFIMDTTNEERIKLACLEAITKLMGYHKDKPENGENVIFYLPLRCFDCKLYRANQEKIRKERTERIKLNEV